MSGSTSSKPSGQGKKRDGVLVPGKEWHDLLARIADLERRKKDKKSRHLEKEECAGEPISVAPASSALPVTNGQSSARDRQATTGTAMEKRQNVVPNQEKAKEAIGTQKKKTLLSGKSESFTIPFWVVVVVLGFAVFGNGLWGGIVFDDSEVLGANGDVKGDTSLWELWVNDYWGNRINAAGVWSCKVRRLSVSSLSKITGSRMRMKREHA